MTTTSNPPRILNLLIQIEGDHSNNWQALLTVQPLHSPWSVARGIQGATGICVTTPHSLLTTLRGFCTTTAVQGATGDGAKPHVQLAWENMEKAAVMVFRGLGSSLQPPNDKRGY